MSDALRSEVDQNYDFFRRNLSRYLGEHAGEYALLKSATVVDFFEGPGDAYREGLRRFSDKIFSIQRVSSEPAEMGLYSVGLA
jgi:hypothetical protein